MIKFRCKSCQKKIGVKDEFAGRAIKCPGCETRIDIPKPEPQPPAEPNDLPDLAGLAALEAAAPAQVQAVDAPGRRCPECNAAVSEQAVICISCGYSFQKGGKKLDTRVTQIQSDAQAGPAKRALARSSVGLVVASIVTMVFATLWVGVALFTGKEFGILAWGMGLLIGLVAGVIGRNPSPIYCGLVGLVSAMGIIGAKAALAGLIFAGSFFLGFAGDWTNYDPQEQLNHNVVMENMLADGEFSNQEAKIVGELLNGVFADYEYDESAFDDDISWGELGDYFEESEKINERVAQQMAQMTQAQIEQAYGQTRARHPGWIEDQNVYLAVIDGMVDSGRLEGGLAQHARNTLRTSLDGDYGETAYTRNTTPAQIQERDEQLRAAAVAEMRTLSKAQEKTVVQDAVRRHPNWITDTDGFYAVLSQMVAQGAFTGEAADYASAEVALNMDQEWDQPFLNRLSTNKRDTLSREVTSAVNLRLLEFDEAQREAALTAAKALHPEWDSFFGISDEDLQAAQAEFEGIETYGDAFASTFRFLDVLWFFLAVSSAYSLALKQGQ